MQFLLTNDDGIDAPGLAALIEAVDPFGEITVIAPDGPVSECSHQVNTQKALRVSSLGSERYAVDGTPADCVRLGLVHLAPKADWVVAGINRGGNLGVDVYLSGTVAAAREAALFGKPAVAFSHYRRAGRPIDWAAATQRVGPVLERLLEQPPQAGAFWNVNFPHVEASDPTPDTVFCPLDPCQLPVDYEINGDRFQYRGVYRDRDRVPGSDVDVCFSGHIAVTQVLRIGSA